MDKFVLKYESDNEWLSHHGILGQKWGVRRFQNQDGSLTAAGKKRYDKIERETKHVSEVADRSLARAKERESERMDYLSKKLDRRIAKTGKTSQELLESGDKKTRQIYKEARRSGVYDAYAEIGHQVVKESLSRREELRKKAVTDPSIKKTPEYKEAERAVMTMFNASGGGIYAIDWHQGTDMGLILIGEEALKNRQKQRQ